MTNWDKLKEEVIQLIKLTEGEENEDGTNFDTTFFFNGKITAYHNILNAMKDLESKEYFKQYEKSKNEESYPEQGV